MGRGRPGDHFERSEMSPLPDPDPKAMEALARRASASLAVRLADPSLPEAALLRENPMKAAVRVGPWRQFEQEAGSVEEAALPLASEEGEEELPAGLGVVPQASEKVVPGRGVGGRRSPVDPGAEKAGGYVPVTNPTDQPSEATVPPGGLSDRHLLTERNEPRPHGHPARDATEVAVKVVNVLR